MQHQTYIGSIACVTTILLFAAGCSSDIGSRPGKHKDVLIQVPVDQRKEDSQNTSKRHQPSSETIMSGAVDSALNYEGSDGDAQISARATLRHPGQSKTVHEQLAREHRRLSGPTSLAPHGMRPRIVSDDQVLTRPANTEKYQDLDSNPVVRVADQSTSTFSIDVDTGAYTNARRFLNAGRLPPMASIRPEEFLNYFNYDYPVPKKSTQPFSVYTEMAQAPWNEKTQLLHIGLQGYKVQAEDRPAANLVFLIDVSGSMSDPNKLGLLKSSLNMMVKDLTASDTISIVVYAGASGVVLEPTAGNQQQSIRQALNALHAGGSTNGEAGIELAYRMAEKKKTDDSINRIILATDGDFNVGISDISKLKSLIERKRKSGIALTTLGFGTGNYNDHLMEQLANVGNGNYAYIDTLNEARKVLSEEMTSTLLTIAKDVKIQIEFNPAQVSEYRLLGYVNRHLENEDFSNDKVDAGEIGAGHSVTALYEIALVGDGGERHNLSRYQQVENEGPDDNSLTNEIAEIRLRYKQPNASKSQLVTQQLQRPDAKYPLADSSDNFRFSAAVAGFAQLLQNSKYLEDFDYADTAELASNAKGKDRFGYRSEFVQLVDLAKALNEQNDSYTQLNQKPEDEEG